MMRRLAAAAFVIATVTAPAIAKDEIPFPTYLDGKNTISPPYVDTDMVPMVRGSSTYTIPGDKIVVKDDETALPGITNDLMSMVAGVVTVGTGSTTALYGNSSDPTVIAINKGTDLAPITTPGTQIRILYRQDIDKSLCNDNSANIGCNAPLLINAIGGVNTNMVTSGIVSYASTSSAQAGGDAQGVNGIADLQDGSTRAAMGAFFTGRSFSTVGFVYGAEISAQNRSGVDYCTVNTIAVGTCDGIWLTSRASVSGHSVSSALHIGNANDGSYWREGITINSNAIKPSISSAGYHDTSTAARSIWIEGTHAAAIAVAANSGHIGLGTLNPAALITMTGVWSMPAYGPSGGAIRQGVGLTLNDTTSTGTVSAAWANQFGPTMTADNPVTYEQAASVVFAPPTAGTNVTIGDGYSLAAEGKARLFGSVHVGPSVPMTLSDGEIGIATITPSGTAPGSVGAKLALVCGTNAGTAKLIVYAGTSATPTSLLDNIGAGVLGC